MVGNEFLSFEDFKDGEWTAQKIARGLGLGLEVKSSFFECI